MSNKTIAVITSTIGKPELERAILSVRNQQYPCKHYIFVDGVQFHDKVRAITDKYPELIVTFLPMNTGADGWTNSYINAIAPFLVKEDIICFLDDDNWYDENHTQVIADAFNTHSIEMAFTLRRLYDEQGKFISEDNTESLGFWTFNKPISFNLKFRDQVFGLNTTIHRSMGHIDTNCMALSLHIARVLSVEWTRRKNNDHNITQCLLKSDAALFCTGKRTVNYLVPMNKFMTLQLKDIEPTEEEIMQLKRDSVFGMNNAIPEQNRAWETPTLLRNGTLFPLKPSDE